MKTLFFLLLAFALPMSMHAALSQKEQGMVVSFKNSQSVNNTITELHSNLVSYSAVIFTLEHFFALQYEETMHYLTDIAINKDEKNYCHFNIYGAGEPGKKNDLAVMFFSLTTGLSLLKEDPSLSEEERQRKKGLQCLLGNNKPAIINFMAFGDKYLGKTLSQTPIQEYITKKADELVAFLGTFPAAPPKNPSSLLVGEETLAPTNNQESVASQEIDPQLPLGDSSPSTEPLED